MGGCRICKLSLRGASKMNNLWVFIEGCMEKKICRLLFKYMWKMKDFMGFLVSAWKMKNLQVFIGGGYRCKIYRFSFELYI